MTTGLGCFAPGCQDDAAVLAIDEMVSCFVSFCDDHEDEWLAKDHIEPVETSD